MNIHALKQQAKHILERELIPGKDQSSIYGSISQLEEIILTLQTNNQQQANEIIEDLENIYLRVNVQRHNPSIQTNIRTYLDQITDRISITLQEVQGTLQEPTTYLMSTESLAQQHGIQTLKAPVHEFKHIPYVQLKNEPGIREAIHKIGLEAHIEKQYRVISTQTQPSTQWNLEMIHASKAWKHNAGEGIRIGVMDTGIQYSHPEIAHSARKTQGYNFVNDNQDFMDRHGHGTHVSGTIAGMDVGVAPNATLYGLKVLNDQGRGNETTILKAGDWAIDNSLHLINASLGSSRYSPAEQAMVSALRKNNIGFVAAAGNAADTGYRYPASYQGAISVAAIDKNCKRASFSQVNNKLTVSAPGVSIYSCTPKGYETMSGTSMAAPHVTGSLALLYVNEPAADIFAKLTLTAKTLGEKNHYGAGLVDALKLIQ